MEMKNVSLDGYGRRFISFTRRQRAGLGAVGLGRELPPDSTDQSPITLTADRAALIRAPRLTDGSTFQVLLVLPAGTSAASVCTAA